MEIVGLVEENCQSLAVVSISSMNLNHKNGLRAGFVKEVSETISEMPDEGRISEKNRNYLLVDQPKAGKFYLLPKIHKAGNPFHSFC